MVRGERGDAGGAYLLAKDVPPHIVGVVSGELKRGALVILALGHKTCGAVVEILGLAAEKGAVIGVGLGRGDRFGAVGSAGLGVAGIHSPADHAVPVRGLFPCHVAVCGVVRARGGDGVAVKVGRHGL